MKRLKEFTNSSHNDLERISRGEKTSRSKKRENVERSAEIKMASVSLSEGDIDEHQFIKMVSHTIDKYFNEDTASTDIPVIIKNYYVNKNLFSMIILAHQTLIKPPDQ